MTDTKQGTDPRALRPNIRLYGSVTDDTLSSFLSQLDGVLGGDDAVVLELFTSGGDAEVGRRIALEIKLLRENAGREAYFVGKTAVYSAGVTVMSGFPAANRYLSRDCVLLIHERRLDQNVHFYGPLRSNVQIAKEICARAQSNWYVTASEALDLGLVASLI